MKRLLCEAGMFVRAFDEQQQKREEIPTEWLERLRKNMRQYSGVDQTDLTVARQILLKINFVTRAWPDTQRKLEKFYGWQERGLEDLLREVQKVYIKRDGEKAKAKTRAMVTAIRERKQHIKNNPCKEEGP